MFSLYFSCMCQRLQFPLFLFLFSFGFEASLCSAPWREFSSLTSLAHFFSSVQLLSHVRLFVTPWTAAHQASLPITNSRSLLKLISTESVMPSNHLILCDPLLLLPSIFPSNRVSSNESVLRITWPKYWSFSFNISPSSEYSELISFRMDWLDSQESSPTVQKHQFFSAQLSL